MARKTFISYKHSESQTLRDEILEALGDDASFYQGETADSPDLTGEAVDTIKSNLTDMMYATSVTIVIISPNMTSSKWIDWEIEYCLKEYSRKGRTSKTNGVIGIIKKHNGGYKWLVEIIGKDDGCKVRMIDSSKLYEIINNNRYNQKTKEVTCDSCKCISQLDGSYIALVDEMDFMADPQKYIENAFDKSESSDDFELTKQR